MEERLIAQETKRTVRLGPKVQIEREVGPGTVPFCDVFRGFERVGAVKAIFGDQTKKILSELNVEVADGRGYMHINAENGSIVVNSQYLREGEEMHVYLDVIHELVHVRQHKEGKELWDRRFAYVDRPTEIEAYKAAVKEARRIGLKGDELVEYLKVEWVNEKEFLRMLRTLGVKAQRVARQRSRTGVPTSRRTPQSSSGP